MGYLVQQGPNAQVPLLADRLLAQLLERFPSLQYKRDVLSAMFHATDEEEAAQQVQRRRERQGLWGRAGQQGAVPAGWQEALQPLP